MTPGRTAKTCSGGLSGAGGLAADRYAGQPFPSKLPMQPYAAHVWHERCSPGRRRGAGGGDGLLTGAGTSVHSQNRTSGRSSQRHPFLLLPHDDLLRDVDSPFGKAALSRRDGKSLEARDPVVFRPVCCPRRGCSDLARGAPQPSTGHASIRNMGHVYRLHVRDFIQDIELSVLS